MPLFMDHGSILVKIKIIYVNRGFPILKGSKLSPNKIRHYNLWTSTHHKFHS